MFPLSSPSLPRLNEYEHFLSSSKYFPLIVLLFLICEFNKLSLRSDATAHSHLWINTKL